MRSTTASRSELPPEDDERVGIRRLGGAKPTISVIAERFAPESPTSESYEADFRRLERRNRNVGEERKAAPVRGLIAALVTLALASMAILIVFLWQGATRYPHVDNAPSNALPEIALSSPDKLEAKAGKEIDFAIAVDSTEALPARSLIAISGLPDGASFSQGRPYGMTGWSLRPDEIGELRLHLPKAQIGAFDMRIELLAADGTQLAQSETRFNIAADTDQGGVSAVESDPSQEIAQVAEGPVPAEPLPSLPQRKPARSANTEPSVKVATVKVVTIKPAPPTRRPHDGAFALGEAAEVPAEWVEIVRRRRHARAGRTVLGDGEGGGKGPEAPRHRAR